MWWGHRHQYACGCRHRWRNCLNHLSGLAIVGLQLGGDKTLKAFNVQFNDSAIVHFAQRRPRGGSNVGNWFQDAVS